MNATRAAFASSCVIDTRWGSFPIAVRMSSGVRWNCSKLTLFMRERASCSRKKNIPERGSLYEPTE